MNEPSIQSLGSRLSDAVRESVAALCATTPLAGVALCTDDDLTTVYFVACSKDDCAHSDGPDYVYLPVEWELDSESDRKTYGALSAELSALADGIPDITARRERLFAVLVDALRGVRSGGMLDEDVLLFVTSTDPGEQLTRLARKAFEELNSVEAYGTFSKVRAW